MCYFFLSAVLVLLSFMRKYTSMLESSSRSLQDMEKYVITKLLRQLFESFSEDVKIDNKITNKINLLQSFLKLEHLDIPSFPHNQPPWLANPEQLHSNLKFIQLYRRHSNFISEEAYTTSQIFSAKFIYDLGVNPVSIDKLEFQLSHSHIAL
uniref:Uncharacterized protein n=1 Tax=Kalanchoe fedtschenkoi TaxID=63787 RepID=A0A7N0TEQ5_KALFE